MATAVQIELLVDEKGAVSGVRVFDSAIKGTSGSVRQLGAELAAVGTRAAAAGNQTKAALDKTGVAALSSVEKTRLLTEEFGIRLPRAMVRLAAESKITQAAIGAIGPALIGLGAIQIGTMVFSQLVEGAQKLWRNYLSLNSAQKEYEEQLEKTKDEDYWNSHDIETTTLRIKEATAAARGYRTEAEAANKGGWGSILTGGPMAMGVGLGMLYAAHKQAGLGVAQQQGLDKLTLEKAQEQHELTLLAIQATHPDAKGRKLAENQEDYSYKRALNARLGNATPDDADAKEKALKDQIARQDASGGGRDAKSQIEELARLREQALESGLRGVALYHAQEAAAIADLKTRDIDSTSAREYVHQKFHNEEMKRLEDQTRATEKIVRASTITGMSGIAKTQRQGEDRIAEVRDSDFEDVDASGHSALADQQRAAISRETDQQIAEEKRSLADYVNNLSDESATHQISGFVRINAEASKQIEELRRKIEAGYGKAPKIGPPSVDQAEGASLLQQGTAAIERNAADQRLELAQRNADETAQIEAEANVRSLSAEKQRTAAIEAEYRARTQKYEEELKAQEISDDDYNRRVAAAAEQRDADMVQASREAREKMAGEFDSFFKSLDHPAEALKSLGDKVAGQAAAMLVQRIQQHGQGAAATPATPEGGIIGLLTGGVFTRGSKSAAAMQDAKAEMPRSHGAAGEKEKTFTVSQATIHIGSATFAGSALAQPGAPGWSAPSTSTSLLAPTAIHQRSPYTGASVPASTSEASPAWGTGAGTSDFSTGSPGAAPTPVGGMGAVMGDLQQGTALARSGISLFNGSKGGGGETGSGDFAETQSASAPGQFDENGNFVSSGSTTASASGGGMLGGGGVGANAMGAVSGGLGLFSAYEGNGGVGGALGGAMSGMKLGMALGGPVGAAIGAAAGAVIGAIGFGGREKARVYDLKQVRPRIGNDIDGYQQGSMDYLGAYADVQSLDQEAKHATNALGPAAQRYYQDTIKKEIKDAEGKLSAEQKAGRSQYTATAAQYDTGGPVNDFGDLATSPDHGLVHMQLGEFTVKPNVYQRNKSTLDALNAGASMDSIHRSYQAAMQSRDARRSSSGGDRTMNMNVHAIDSKGVIQFFNQYKHHMRAALNSSYAENSGSADA
jgi:hypothetical protein